MCFSYTMYFVHITILLLSIIILIESLAIRSTPDDYQKVKEI